MSRDPAPRALTVCSYLFVTALSLMGCSDVDDSPDATESTQQTTPTSLATDDPETKYLGDYEGIPEDTSGPNTPSAERQQAAMERATAALTTYYAADKDYDEWFADLRPLLSREAQAAYETVDPDSIPENEVTGDPSVVRHDGGGAITLAVPTTLGDVQVDLIVQEAGHDWTVQRFRFPSGSN